MYLKFSRFYGSAKLKIRFWAKNLCHVTWRPEIWHTISFDRYLHCVKISAFYTSGFGVIRKKVKTWTHLPEKSLSKNKGTHSIARAWCPNYVVMINRDFCQTANKTVRWQKHGMHRAANCFPDSVPGLVGTLISVHFFISFPHSLKNFKI